MPLARTGVKAASGRARSTLERELNCLGVEGGFADEAVLARRERDVVHERVRALVELDGGSRQRAAAGEIRVEIAASSEQIRIERISAKGPDGGTVDGGGWVRLDQADATPLELCVHLAVVELPAYLSGPEIVTRSGESQVLRADFERWAEPLESAFARVLAWDLARLVPSERVFRAPWERPGPTDLAPSHRSDRP